MATFSFKILRNLLSRYTSGPGPSGIAWQHLLKFSRPILRHTAMFHKWTVDFKKSKKKKKLKMRCSGGNETTTRQNSNIKNQNCRSHSSQCRYWKRKIVIFKITGISLEFILIYIFAGLLTILGAVLLAVCINQYRKKGNQSTKRCVGTICFKNSSFPLFQKIQYIPNIPVYVRPPEPCSLFWRVRPLIYIFCILHNCSRAHYGEAARRKTTSKKIWLSSDTQIINFIRPNFSISLNGRSRTWNTVLPPLTATSPQRSPL